MWRKKRKNKNNIKDWTGLKCYYIWPIEWELNIVYYEWTVVEDLWDKVLCNMRDRNINRSDDYFNITLEKKVTNLNY